MSDGRCVYCLRPFSSPRPRRCCSPDCERRVRGKAAYVTRSRRQAVSAIMTELQRRLRFVPQWRQAAMGAEPDLLTIFGAKPEPGPIRHGDTLDAF